MPLDRAAHAPKLHASCGAVRERSVPRVLDQRCHTVVSPRALVRGRTMGGVRASVIDVLIYLRYPRCLIAWLAWNSEKKRSAASSAWIRAAAFLYMGPSIHDPHTAIYGAHTARPRASCTSRPGGSTSSMTATSFECASFASSERWRWREQSFLVLTFVCTLAPASLLTDAA